MAYEPGTWERAIRAQCRCTREVARARARVRARKELSTCSKHHAHLGARRERQAASAVAPASDTWERARMRLKRERLEERDDGSLERQVRVVLRASVAPTGQTTSPESYCEDCSRAFHTRNSVQSVAVYLRDLTNRVRLMPKHTVLSSSARTKHARPRTNRTIGLGGQRGRRGGRWHRGRG